MAPKSKKQLEDQKHEKRKQIMQAALEVFATHGFHGASVSHIASTAGIAKGLIYSYFESKEDMLRAIISNGIEEMVTVLKPALENDLTPAFFEKLISSYFEYLQNNLSYWRLYFSIALQPQVHEIVEKEASTIGANYLHLMDEYYKQQGSKNPEADSMLTHAMLDGLTLNIVLNHHGLDNSAIIKMVINNIIKPRF